MCGCRSTFREGWDHTFNREAFVVEQEGKTCEFKKENLQKVRRMRESKRRGGTFFMAGKLAKSF